MIINPSPGISYIPSQVVDMDGVSPFREQTIVTPSLFHRRMEILLLSLAPLALSFTNGWGIFFSLLISSELKGAKLIHATALVIH